MQTCDCCGNEYEPSLAITYKDREYHFDCFECAIQILAPSCLHCGTRIIGHGMHAEAGYFCCAHCARAEGEKSLRDSA